MGTEKATNVSNIAGDDEIDEEPGEVVESAPPLKVGEERVLNHTSGVKKKLIKRGIGLESPEFGDEVTIHYVGTLLDGTKFDSSRDSDRDGPFNLKLGHGNVAIGLDHGIITMKKGEIALFTLPPELGYGSVGRRGIPPDSNIQFEVELISWITVVDVCNDGGIIKKILEKGEHIEQPGDLDEVLVKYQVMLADGTIVEKTPEEGTEFYVKDGHFCAALPKAIKTMRREEKVKLLVQPQYAFGEVGRDATDVLALIPPNSMLIIDLNLVSFKPVIDITGDSKVFKKILKAGEGTVVANEGAVVTIRYTARLEDGTIFERKGFDGDEPLEFITDEEQVIIGLDRAASTMKKGEQAILTITPEYGFGSIEVKRELASVPPCSTVFYDVEMLDFIKEKAPWEMSNHEKIEAAGRKKEEGNILFKSGKYQRAGKKYDKALDCVSEEGSFEDFEQKLVNALRVTCWLNGAACSLKLNDFQEAIKFCSKVSRASHALTPKPTLTHTHTQTCWLNGAVCSLKLNDFQEAIKFCSKVLDIEFHNVKALYRRAQAYMETTDLDLAEWDIKKALEVDPHNRDVKSILKTLKQLQAESNKRDAKLYKNMFARMIKGELGVPSKKLKVERADDGMGMEKVADNQAQAPPDDGMG